jgi:hypothetical protein
MPHQSWSKKKKPLQQTLKCPSRTFVLCLILHGYNLNIKLSIKRETILFCMKKKVVFFVAKGISIENLIFTLEHLPLEYTRSKEMKKKIRFSIDQIMFFQNFQLQHVTFSA